MGYSQITFDAEGPIGVLTLNNPSKVNALSKTMIAEITQVLEELATVEDIRVLILRAAGKHFCAGHDLSEMLGQGMRTYKEIFDDCTRMMQLLHAIPQPVIAQVQGIATAAGCQLVAWCDLALAEEGARFATPGVRIGLFCTTPMVALTRAIGRKAAMEMLLTGRYVSAAEAKDLGLINRVVPAAELTSATHALALQIASASAYVLGLGKQAFYAQVDQADAQAYAFASQTMALNNLAEDAQEGIAAFIKKSTPEWKNR